MGGFVFLWVFRFWEDIMKWTGEAAQLLVNWKIMFLVACCCCLWLCLTHCKSHCCTVNVHTCWPNKAFMPADTIHLWTAGFFFLGVFYFKDVCSLQRPWLQSAASLAPGRVTSSRLSYFVRSSLHLTEFLKLSQYACFSKRRWVLLEAATKETLTLKIEPNVFQLQSDWPPTGYFFPLSQPQKWQESTSVIWPSGGHCLSLGEIIGWIDPKVSLPLTAPVYNSKIRSCNNELTHGATNLQNVCHACRHLFSVFTPGVYSVLSTRSYFFISIFFSRNELCL